METETEWSGIEQKREREEENETTTKSAFDTIIHIMACVRHK